MNSRYRVFFWIALGAVFLLALVALTTVFRAEVREGIVLPLQAWFRGVRQNWMGMDADFRWSIFIILLGLMVFLSFPGPQRTWERKPATGVETGAGRLAFWRSELKILLGRGYVNRFSIFSLRRLVLEVVGFRQQMEPEEAEAWLQARLEARDGDSPPAELPPALRLLVEPAALQPPPTPSAPVQGLREFLQYLMSGGQALPERAPAITPEQVETIIRYLENILEVSNEDQHHS